MLVLRRRFLFAGGQVKFGAVMVVSDSINSDADYVVRLSGRSL